MRAAAGAVHHSADGAPPAEPAGAGAGGQSLAERLQARRASAALPVHAGAAATRAVAPAPAAGSPVPRGMVLPVVPPVPALPAASLIDVIRGMRAAASAGAPAPAAAVIHGPAAPAAGSSPVVHKMAARSASVSFAPENLVAQASRPSPLSGAAAILPPSATEHVVEVQVTSILKNANSGGKGKGAAPPIHRTAVVEVLYNESDLVGVTQPCAYAN